MVNLPTSSGKTIIAEFKILQALNQFHDTEGKIAYVVPTRALVNQITSRLRRDLSNDSLNIRVEKMSGALEIDSFEDSILESKAFDILVTTPEKLNLIIRHPQKKDFAKKLVLTIIDEAHNISNKMRGLNLEMLISNIQKDCDRSHLLLMTPFIPNHKEVAKWLDPFNPQSISMDLDWWQPNDKIVGVYYADGERNDITINFKPLVTHSSTMMMKNEIKLGHSTSNKFSMSKIRQSNLNLTALAASQLGAKNILILGGTIKNTWSIAEKLDAVFTDITDRPNLDLVARYIQDELGESFPLAKYVKKGIGVHNSGLPDDIKELMEWLMETNSLNILISTTTIAQGINFPVNAILLTTHHYPREKMPSMDFWNLIGRAGRVDQHSIGFIGIATDKKNSLKTKKIIEYVKNQTEELISVLKNLVEEVIKTDQEINLRTHSNEPEWSSFLQYIAHMYRQSNNLQHFITEINLDLGRTFGFTQLTKKNQDKLIDAVKEYAEYLDDHKNLAVISDITGFNPDTIQKTISKIEQLDLKDSDWTKSNLFSGQSNTLSKLVGIMLNDIPEIKKQLSEIKIGNSIITNDSLSGIIVDWVSGKELDEISQKYFNGTDINSMSNCVKAIYGKITNAATWGMASLQKLPTSGISDELDSTEQHQLSNLPSMIFYGVDTDEAILMRLNNIPRGISKKMGNLYKNDISQDQRTPSSVLSWIKGLDEEQWNLIVPHSKRLSGKEYKQIWKKISGN